MSDDFLAIPKTFQSMNSQHTQFSGRPVRLKGSASDPIGSFIVILNPLRRLLFREGLDGDRGFKIPCGGAGLGLGEIETGIIPRARSSACERSLVHACFGFCSSTTRSRFPVFSSQGVGVSLIGHCKGTTSFSCLSHDFRFSRL